MPERFPEDTMTLDHMSTILLIISTIAILPILFIVSVRYAVPAEYEAVLPGFTGAYFAIILVSVFVLLTIFIVGYYRTVPPTRVPSKDTDEGAGEIVAGSLAIGMIGLPLFVVSVLSLGQNISADGGAFVHGIAAIIPLFVSLAIVLSSIAGFIEARRLAEQREK